MTAKEKAADLVEKFTFLEGDFVLAVKCATMAVEEIISFCNGCPILNKEKDTDNIWGYWQDVLSELRQLK